MINEALYGFCDFIRRQLISVGCMFSFVCTKLRFLVNHLLQHFKPSVVAVMNGTNAPVTPYHAHLLIQTDIGLPELQTFIGSGALISRLHVLTCAQNLLG